MTTTKAYQSVTGISDPFDFSKFLPVLSEIVVPSQDSLRSTFFERLQELQSTGIFRVPEHLKNDMAAVSFNIYATETLWWILCLYNGIDEAYYVPTGTEIRFPSITTLDLLLNEFRGEVIELAAEEVAAPKLPSSPNEALLYLYQDSEITFVRVTPNGSLAIIFIDDAYCGFIEKGLGLTLTGDLIQVYDDFSAPSDSDFIAQFVELINPLDSPADPENRRLKVFKEAAIYIEDDGLYLNLLTHLKEDCSTIEYLPAFKFVVNESRFPQLPIDAYYRGDVSTNENVILDDFLSIYGIDGAGFTSRLNFLGFSLDGISYEMGITLNSSTGLPLTYFRSLITTNHNPDTEIC